MTTTDRFDLGAAPLRIATVRLRVRDLARVAAFYRRTLGLAPLSATRDAVALGVAGSPLLELVGDPAPAPADRRQAGLFHTAFLMPSRADLARWLAHATATGAPITGASDHGVSEAIYLDDPEGNGVEVYADRPVSRWRDGGGAIRLTTAPLDGAALLAAGAGAAWAGFPPGGAIGHVHLQVGDTAQADGFYRDVLGLEVAAGYPAASFYGAGGYHHQLAANVWNSRGAGRRPAGAAGLDAVEIVLDDAARLAAIVARAEHAGVAVAADAHGAVLRDPWGTALALRA